MPDETSTVPPLELANAGLLEYAVLGQSVTYSGHSSLFVDGKELGPVPCLAICQPFDKNNVLLLHCDRDWTVLALAEYSSLTEAKKFADRIYRGVSQCWVKPGPRSAEAASEGDGGEADLRCSFCGKRPDQVNQLIEKGNARICDICIEEFHETLHEHS